jgi:hypothetical protein
MHCGTGSAALRAEGVDSLVIKELMGHESLATTAICVVPLRMQCTASNLLPTLDQMDDQPNGVGNTEAASDPTSRS